LGKVGEIFDFIADEIFSTFIKTFSLS